MLEETECNPFETTLRQRRQMHSDDTLSDESVQATPTKRCPRVPVWVLLLVAIITGVVLHKPTSFANYRYAPIVFVSGRTLYADVYVQTKKQIAERLRQKPHQPCVAAWELGSAYGLIGIRQKSSILFVINHARVTPTPMSKQVNASEPRLHCARAWHQTDLRVRHTQVTVTFTDGTTFEERTVILADKAALCVQLFVDVVRDKVRC